LHAPAAEEGLAGDEQGIGPLALKRREGGIDLADGAGVENFDLQPSGMRRSRMSRDTVSAIDALAGLTSTAMRTALGTNSCRSASRFATNSAAKKLIPVRFPPGRARLATRPSLTGSSPTRKTMGIVVVAALAVIAAAVLVAAMTVT
jgi:hypothetical protein